MRDRIIDKMTKLYLMFTVPVAIFCETDEIQFSIKWTNPEAEQLYRRYEEILNDLLRREKVANYPKRRLDTNQ